LLLIKEDEVIGDKSLHGCSTRWVGMHVNFLLSGLGVLTQARPNVVAESHNMKEKIMDLILIMAGYQTLLVVWQR
jgi:hypothetical protein